jgi:hypothetical protein
MMFVDSKGSRVNIRQSLRRESVLLETEAAKWRKSWKNPFAPARAEAGREFHRFYRSEGDGAFLVHEQLKPPRTWSQDRWKSTKYGTGVNLMR